MRNLLITFSIAGLLLSSCSSESDFDQEEINDLQKFDNDKKVTVCHKGKETISISVNALQAHLDHGDIVGDCDDNLVCHWEPIENTCTSLLVMMTCRVISNMVIFLENVILKRPGIYLCTRSCF